MSNLEILGLVLVFLALVALERDELANTPIRSKSLEGPYRRNRKRHGGRS